MSIKADKILIGLILLIFLISIGNVSATEINDNITNNQDYLPETNDLQLNLDTNIDNEKLNEGTESNQDINYTGEVFENHDFEEDDVGSSKISGWNSSWYWKGYSNHGVIEDYDYLVDDQDYQNFDVSEGSNKVLFIEETGDGFYELSQYIDLTTADSIAFSYHNEWGGDRFEINVWIDEDTVGTINSFNAGWNTYNLDTSGYSGIHLFKITVDDWPWNRLLFDHFIVTYNDKVTSNFNFLTKLIEDISVQFTNKATGKINKIFWDFGDGTNSTDINPTHNFKSGTYTVTLTVANDNNIANYSQVLSFNFPTLNGKMYATVQDAIDNATDGDVIDVPVDLSENIIIDKNLTLNFNGNKLTGTGSSPVIQVTGGAQATIKNITLENSNILATDDESSLTIIESNIADANITLNVGNIALNGNDFTGSFITVVNANAVIANNNIGNGGIKVNGGKSRINNNVLSGNDVAITQTEGETNITNNVITDNNIGVNVTNGTAKINFNVIFNNDKVALAYIGSVDASNNWFGVFQATFSTTVPDAYVDVYAPNAEQPAWLVLTLNCNETTLSSAQNYTIGVDLTLNSKGENTSTLGVLPKFSLPVSTELGHASAVNVENSIGEFTLTTATLTSDDAIFTINGEDYTLDVNIFKIEDRINELETQLADAQANASQLASDLADANQKADNLTTQLSEAQKTIQNLSNPISTTIAANTLSIKALDSGNIQVTLKDANNNLLANKDVQVIINGVVYNGKTGDNGVAKIAVKFASAGTYYATVSFAGDNAYKSSIGTSKVVVSKKATKITAPKKTFKAKVKTKKVTITLKSGSAVLKSKKITLKVNGKTYTAKTNSKGVATIKVTKLTKKGTFTYTVKFAGDKAYNAITKKGKMTIK